MARDRKRNLSWKYQISEALKSRLAIGESKFLAKRDGTYKEKIYSWETYRTYQKQLLYFTNFIKENHTKCKNIADISPEIVNSYLQHHIDQEHSAYTLKLIISSICKITDLDREMFIETPSRLRREIKRGRGERQKPFAEHLHKDLADFCRGTGVRKGELRQVRGTDLEKVDGKYYLNIHKNTKGGRLRKAEITGNIEKIVELCQKAGEKKIFEYFPERAPIHNYRADYCKSIYKQYERHPSTLAKFKRQNNTKELYICRGDKKGVVYDRQAMLIASENIGHSRENVIASNYLH